MVDALDCERRENGGGMLTLFRPREGEERLAPVGEHPQAALRELTVRAVLHGNPESSPEHRPGLGDPRPSGTGRTWQRCWTSTTVKWPSTQPTRWLTRGSIELHGADLQPEQGARVGEHDLDERRLSEVVTEPPVLHQASVAALIRPHRQPDWRARRTMGSQ
jgi:hypothetical protein